MIELSRYCLACRRLLTSLEKTALIIGPATTKWVKKREVFVAKPENEGWSCFCDTCADKMMGLINAQQDKGVKVL